MGAQGVGRGMASEEGRGGCWSQMRESRKCGEVHEEAASHHNCTCFSHLPSCIPLPQALVVQYARQVLQKAAARLTMRHEWYLVPAHP
jgi:hypothetical protein